MKLTIKGIAICLLYAVLELSKAIFLNMSQMRVKLQNKIKKRKVFSVKKEKIVIKSITDPKILTIDCTQDDKCEYTKFDKHFYKFKI
jgi:hypothetical protein